MSLTQVLISSGLVEKIIMKYITSQPSPSSAPSTPTSSDSPSSPQITDAYDTEVQKLFALCLDVADDEACMYFYIYKFIYLNLFI